MICIIFMLTLAFCITIIIGHANGNIAYNKAYAIEKAKQHAKPKTWDQLWKESGLTDADIPELIKALEILKKENL